MGWYRRLIYDAFRRCCRKISPVESFYSISNPTRSRISQPIFKNSVMENYVVKNNQRKVSDSFAKRFYSNVNHSKAKECGHWYENRRNLIKLGLLVCGASCVYYWNLETVPFTKRRHCVLFPTCLEKKLSDALFELDKSTKYKENLVHSHHPQSVRVEKIGHDMIRALREGLRKTNDHTSYAHLEEFNWEFILVDEPSGFSARCYSGGKIVVSTCLLNETDDEIAHVIGHEIGHAIARHNVCKLWHVLLGFIMSERLKRLSDFFIVLPLYRRNEMEADYIGLFVSAYAGYDPRIAPQSLLKLESRSPSQVDDRWSSHPHIKKRAQLLSQPKVMEEVLSIYRKTSKEKDNDKETLDS